MINYVNGIPSFRYTLFCIKNRNELKSISSALYWYNAIHTLQWEEKWSWLIGRGLISTTRWPQWRVMSQSAIRSGDWRHTGRLSKYIETLGARLNVERKKTWPGRSDPLVVMSTPSTQRVASEYRSPLRWSRTPWRNGWIQGWDRESTICSWNILLSIKVKKYPKNDEDMWWKWWGSWGQEPDWRVSVS